MNKIDLTEKHTKNPTVTHDCSVFAILHLVKDLIVIRVILIILIISGPLHATFADGSTNRKLDEMFH